MAGKLDDIFNAKFETWEHEGKFYHSVGLLQWWRRGYGPFSAWMADPPVMTKRFKRWCEKHGVEVAEFMVGPPNLVFPSKDVADKFERYWHKTARWRTLPGRWVRFFGPDYKLTKNNTEVLYGGKYNYANYLLEHWFGVLPRQRKDLDNSIK